MDARQSGPVAAPACCGASLRCFRLLLTIISHVSGVVCGVVGLRLGFPRGCMAAIIGKRACLHCCSLRALRKACASPLYMNPLSALLCLHRHFWCCTMHALPSCNSICFPRCSSICFPRCMLTPQLVLFSHCRAMLANCLIHPSSCLPPCCVSLF